MGAPLTLLIQHDTWQGRAVQRWDVLSNDPGTGTSDPCWQCSGSWGEGGGGMGGKARCQVPHSCPSHLLAGPRTGVVLSKDEKAFVG